MSVRPLGALGRASRWTKRHPARASAITALVVFGLAVAGLSGFLVARWDELTAGEIALADQKYQRALERAYLDIGEGSPAEAIGALRQLTAARPSDPHALAGLMMAHLEAGRPEDAQALLDALPTELRPTFRPLADWTARRLGREPSQATAGASTALSSFLEASTALLRFHAGDRDAANVALAKATEAITRSQTVPAIFAFTRTHAAAHAGEERSACEAAETVVTHWPGSGTAWYWRGLALAAHDPEQSREAFRRAIALEPDLGAAYHDLGKLESDLGRNAEALPSFERAVTLLPKVAQVHSSLAGCLAELSKNREAETAYARAAELDPNDAEIAVGRCALWHREGRHEEARIEARRATKLAPTNVRAWFDLAVVLGSLGQREEAVTAWKQAAAIAPHDPEIARHLGTSLIAADRREEGLKFLADQAARFPQDPRLAFALGNALFESRRSNDALPHLVRASSEAPAVLEHRLRLSDALLAKGDIEGADRELDAALTLAPASADAWMKRGAVRLKQRRMLEAESCFDEALRHSDGNPRSIALHAQVVAPLRPYFDVLRRAEAAAAGTDPLPDTETLTTFFALARKIEHHRHYVALWRRLIEERAIDRPAGPSELASDAILSAALCALGPRPAPGESLSAAGRQQALGLATLWLSDELARWAADVVQSASRASAARTALERLDRALPDRDPAIDGTAELDDSDWQIQRARLRSRVDEL